MAELGIDVGRNLATSNEEILALSVNVARYIVCGGGTEVALHLLELLTRGNVVKSFLLVVSGHHFSLSFRSSLLMEKVYSRAGDMSNTYFL